MDSDKVEKDKIKYADSRELCTIVEEYLRNIKETDLRSREEELISIAEEALRRVEDDDQLELSIVYRTVGKVLERFGEELKAIEYYEKALSLNHKIGIKRNLSALKKKNKTT